MSSMARKLSRKQLSKFMSSIGRKGGKARAKNLSPNRMSDIAKNAANARWAYLKETI